jgi:hypothetical protein
VTAATPVRGVGTRVALMLLAVGAGLPWARAARAQDSVAVPRPWYEEVAVNGFVSTSYSYSFNHPDSRLNTYRVFDFDDNTFKLDVVELVIQRAVTKPRDSGFRVDFEAGGSIPRVSAASGLFRDPATVQAQDFDLQQAFASYVVPAGSGLRVDAGKFVTHFGAEVIEGYDGWNDNATRSLLFGYAIPFTHTGVRASYGFGPKLAAMAMLVNGWDNATDNNRAKSVGSQLAFTPNGSLALYLNGMIGAERSGNNSDLRSLLDAVATLAVSPHLKAGVNIDFGQEQRLAPRPPPEPPATATWSGVAGYLRFTATDGIALVLRGEGFRDRDGVRTGTPQTLGEVTFTPEFRVTTRFILRGDVRRDWSDRQVFTIGSRPADHQTTVLLSALTWF